MTELGIFILPDAGDHESTIAQAVAADEGGLDYVAIQDHPYQRRFLETWTLLSFLAARTKRVKLVPDVLNLPLRLPAMIAKSAATLDVLSGGRVELGLGAGAFWDAIEAMGGPGRTAKESVDAVEEGLQIIRSYLDGDESVGFDGDVYRVRGAKPGPPPAHEMGIWLGAYGPRMLALTGRLADGWLPSVGGKYLSDDDVPAMQKRIDDKARKADRDPSDIKRVANVMIDRDDPAALRERILQVADLGFEAVLVSVPGEGAVDFIKRLASDVAPEVR